MNNPLNTLTGLICVMALKDRIKEAMDGAGLSPAELARATKSTNAAVTFWLNGATKSLKGEKAALIESATGYNAQWIISGQGEKKRTLWVDGPTQADFEISFDAPFIPKLQPSALIEPDILAINNQVSRPQLMAGLGKLFEAMDSSTRAMALVLIGQLAEHPQDHARIAAMIDLSIASSRKKAA